MLKLEREKIYYALAGASLGDLIWIIAEKGISVFEISIALSVMISAVSSSSHDLEESLPNLASFILPFFSVQILLSFWYLNGIENRLEYNISSGYLLTTSLLSSIVLTVSFLLFSLIFRLFMEFRHSMV